MAPHSASFFEALIFGGGEKTSLPSSKIEEYYWGQSTAPIDWCEDNYSSSAYVAELHNTWTNIFYVVAGACVIFKCHSLSLPLQYYACGLSIILTGVFSGLFHATLWYWMQRLDEIFENAILITMIHSDRPHAFSVSSFHFIGSTLGIVYISQFLFCEIHLVASILLCLVKFKRIANSDKDISSHVSNAAMWTLLGFGCWLVDRLGCEFIVSNFPFNPQLHGWWHLFTSLALWDGFVAISKVHVRNTSHNKLK